MSARVVVSSFVILALALAAPNARAADASVKRLVREWLQRLEARRPDLASAYGSSRAAARLVPISDATLAEDAAWLRDFRARLAAVGGSLSTAAVSDRDALLAWTAAESAAVAPGGRWQRDPGAYVELIADALAEPAMANKPGPCERAQRAARRLAQVPEVLRGAQVALRRPERGATARAAARLDTLIAHWRAAYPARFAACREPYRQADLVQGDTTAIRAATSFVRWLRADVLPATEPGAEPAARAALPALRSLAR